MRACPLRSLAVKNFKSIAEGEIEFRPLTVMVGMNSSGKSSLLEAVRFLSQTAAAGKPGTEVPLNGTKVRLGTFDDARTDGADGPIAFHAELTAERHGDPDSVMADDGIHLTLGVTEPDIRPDRGHAKIGVNKIEVSGTPILFCAEQWLRAIWFRVELVWMSVWDRCSDYMFEDSEEYKDELLHELRLQFEAEVDNLEGKSLIFAGANDIRRAFDRAFIGADLSTYIEFLQGMFHSITEMDDDEAVRMELLRFFLAMRGIPSASSALTDEASRILEKLIGPEMVTHLVESQLDSPDSSQGEDYFIRAYYRGRDAQMDAVSDLHSTPKNLDSASIQRVINLSKDRTKRYSTAEIASLGLSMIEVGGLRFVEERKQDDADPDLPDFWPRTDISEVARLFVQECNDDGWAKDPVLKRQAKRALRSKLRPAVTALLQDRVRYLGPLRQAPRVFSDFREMIHPDVGAAGENLAWTLQWYGTTTVDVPGFGQADLVDGLEHWMRELGIVENVTVEARGRAGVSVEVRPPYLNRQIDLTSVGVGVSQVLPVLAVCLLAEPGNIVLLEQPELHLHPALQMHLADFLLACVESGRQIIVETHSEHLVNRLRRRVAEDSSNAVGDLVRIVFAERDAEGHTSFRPSDINPLGGLSEDWPNGFLDIGARDAQILLQAGLAKHRRLIDK
ncbi:MAG: AAA family ATPase [Bryobacterales bacterium]|nr:AAA family ATPase [Bryobacterales bacterium]